MTGPTDGEPADPPAGDEVPLPAEGEAGSQADEAAPDTEGPRRRARREREERRAAQARAVAIEEARREAKRRTLGRPLPETETLGRGAVRGLKLLMWTA